jgi:hypothetical protein
LLQQSDEYPPFPDRVKGKRDPSLPRTAPPSPPPTIDEIEQRKLEIRRKW